MMSRLISCATLLLFSLMMTACSTVAPVYQPDFGSVNTMKNSALPNMRSGSVTLASPSLDKVTIRGGNMKSPYGTTYADYFKFAIDEQLKQARLFNQSANTVISCTVEKNDLDGSGSSTGTADLTAKFTVRKADSEVYNKTLAIHHEWPSSFVGAIAIPNAQQGYMAAVQKLMDALFSDPSFIKAVEK